MSTIHHTEMPGSGATRTVAPSRAAVVQTWRAASHSVYAPPTFTSRDPLFEQKPWLTPYHYCSNNPVGRVDPSGMFDDWYENEKGQMVYTTEYTSEAAFKKSGIKGRYMGKTCQKGNTYYSLLGQVVDANSTNGKITKKIDEAFMEEAKYLSELKNVSNAFDAEDSKPSSTDFSGIVKFKNEVSTRGLIKSLPTTSENFHGPNELGKYAGLADIYLFVTQNKMSGSLGSWSPSSCISGNNGNICTPMGCYLRFHRTGTNNNVLLGLDFKNKNNLNGFKKIFFKLFPVAR